MKRMKFLAITFILLMGVAVTSCMDSGDPTVGGTFPMKVVSTYPYTFVFSDSDVKYVAVNSDNLLSSNLETGDIAYVAWSYNSDEQKVDQNTKKINVTVSGVKKITGECYVLNNDGSSYENATVNNIGVSDNYGNSIIFQYFDKNTLFVPIVCLASTSETLDKQSFVLVYDETATQPTDTEMKFYLRHKSDDTTANQRVLDYKAFDIREALYRFEATTGGKPEKITILVNETSKEYSNKLEDAKEELQSYSVNYEFKD